VLEIALVAVRPATSAKIKFKGRTYIRNSN
jgi:hypothetical protein